jgi:hypothetical protein
MPVKERFEFIDHRIYTAWWQIANDGVIKPALTSVLFILLYPRISKFFYKDWLQKQVEIKELRDEIEKATLLTREESQAIQMRILRIKDEYEKTIQNLATENEALKKTSAHDNEFDQLRKEAQQADRNRDITQIKNLVEDGQKILFAAQNASSSLSGIQLANVQSWVTGLGDIIQKNYGENSQKYTDYQKIVATQNFYNIHSNWNSHIALLLGIAKNIASELQQNSATP